MSEPVEPDDAGCVNDTEAVLRADVEPDVGTEPEATEIDLGDDTP